MLFCNNFWFQFKVFKIYSLSNESIEFVKLIIFDIVSNDKTKFSLSILVINKFKIFLLIGIRFFIILSILYVLWPLIVKESIILQIQPILSNDCWQIDFEDNELSNFEIKSFNWLNFLFNSVLYLSNISLIISVFNVWEKLDSLKVIWLEYID